MLYNLSDIRKTNARFLANNYCGGTYKEFGARIGKSANHVSNFMRDNAQTQIGNQLARDIEQAFGKETYWLDREHDDIDQYNHKFEASNGFKSIQNDISRLATMVLNGLPPAYTVQAAFFAKYAQANIKRCAEQLEEDSKEIITGHLFGLLNIALRLNVEYIESENAFKCDQFAIYVDSPFNNTPMKIQQSVYNDIQIGRVVLYALPFPKDNSLKFVFHRPSYISLTNAAMEDLRLLTPLIQKIKSFDQITDDDITELNKVYVDTHPDLKI